MIHLVNNSDLLLLLLLIVFNLDLHKARDLCTTNGTFISLHAHNLRTLNTQAHVTTGQHNCVLGDREAYNALSLSFISDVGCSVIDTVDVINLEYSVIVL